MLQIHDYSHTRQNAHSFDDRFALLERGSWLTYRPRIAYQEANAAESSPEEVRGYQG